MEDERKFAIVGGGAGLVVLDRVGCQDKQRSSIETAFAIVFTEVVTC